jgi:putative ABC transport system permease protein
MGGGIVLAITLLTVGWHSYRAASSNPVKSLKSE